MYGISDVTTVQDLQESMQKASGVEPDMHHVLFGEKRLALSDVLSEVGVTEGAQLTMVPVEKKKKEEAGDATSKMMEDYLKKSGIDKSQLDEMMKSMGGSGEGGMPSMKESMEAMTSMMNSPLFQQYMSDPEQLEKSRQMILNNPMLKSMMGGMPGMEELLNDPVAWREAMMAAANMYKDMDPETLMQAMGGANPGGAGLFEGTLENSAAAAALNELDEDD